METNYYDRMPRGQDEAEDVGVGYYPDEHGFIEITVFNSVIGYETAYLTIDEAEQLAQMLRGAAAFARTKAAQS